jgi:hypothetical protein
MELYKSSNCGAQEEGKRASGSACLLRAWRNVFGPVPSGRCAFNWRFGLGVGPATFSDVLAEREARLRNMMSQPQFNNYIIIKSKL